MADTEEFTRIAQDTVRSVLDARAEREAAQEAAIASLVKTSQDLSSSSADVRATSSDNQAKYCGD